MYSTRTHSCSSCLLHLTSERILVRVYCIASKTAEEKQQQQPTEVEESAARVVVALGNIRALIAHYLPKIDAFAASHSIAALDESSVSTTVVLYSIFYAHLEIRTLVLLIRVHSYSHQALDHLWLASPQPLYSTIRVICTSILYEYSYCLYLFVLVDNIVYICIVCIRVARRCSRWCAPTTSNSRSSCR